MLADEGWVPVAEKCGYRLEGVAREAWYHRGRHLDMAVYSLLRQEFPTTLPEVIARLGGPAAISDSGSVDRLPFSDPRRRSSSAPHASLLEYGL